MFLFFCFFALKQTDCACKIRQANSFSNKTSRDDNSLYVTEKTIIFLLFSLIFNFFLEKKFFNKLK